MFKQKNVAAVVLLSGLMLLLPTFSGCDSGSSGNGGGISSVIQWIADVATGTGEWIQEKASTLAQAVKGLFYRWKTYDGVEYNTKDPLIGRCSEDKKITARAEKAGGRVVKEVFINLKGLQMKRDSETAPWVVDVDALPEELKQEWDEIHKQVVHS